MPDPELRPLSQRNCHDHWDCDSSSQSIPGHSFGPSAWVWIWETCPWGQRQRPRKLRDLSVGCCTRQRIWWCSNWRQPRSRTTLGDHIQIFTSFLNRYVCRHSDHIWIYSGDIFTSFLNTFRYIHIKYSPRTFGSSAKLPRTFEAPPSDQELSRPVIFQITFSSTALTWIQAYPNQASWLRTTSWFVTLRLLRAARLACYLGVGRFSFRGLYICESTWIYLHMCEYISTNMCTFVNISCGIYIYPNKPQTKARQTWIINFGTRPTRIQRPLRVMGARPVNRK